MNIVQLTHAAACALDPYYEVDEQVLSGLKDKDQLNEVWKKQTGVPWKKDGHKLVYEEKIPTGKKDEAGNDKLKVARSIEAGIGMLKIIYHEQETSLLLMEGSKGNSFSVSGMTLPQRDLFLDRLNGILGGELYAKWDAYEKSRPETAREIKPRRRGKEQEG